MTIGAHPCSSLAALERPGHWTADEAITVLRHGSRDAAARCSRGYADVVTWLRRDRPAPPDPASADALYAAARIRPQGERHFRIGRDMLDHAGYGQVTAGVDPWMAARFLGLGCPWLAGLPESGERVLDLGCGSGVDAAIAATAVGPGGLSHGVDARPTLLPRPERWLPNASYAVADADRTHLVDGWATTVIANGLPPLLSQDSAMPVLAEVRRVLAPGGTLRAVVLVTDPDPQVSADLRIVRARWTGKPLLEEISRVIVDAGLRPTEERRVPSPLTAHPDAAALQAVLLIAERV